VIDRAALPPLWIECKLGDVLEYGVTRKSEPEEIPDDAWVLELEDIESNTSRVLQRVTFADRRSKSTKNQFSRGDVLYGKLRPYLNKVVRATESGYCSTEVVPLSPPPEVNNSYLFYWLKTPRYLEYVDAVSHGLNMPRLGTGAGKTAPFILAPLPEQERIASKLDDLLSRIDNCRERLDRIPIILKRFRQSVLSAAAGGELTREWREAQPRSRAWTRTSVGEVASQVFDGPFGSHLKSKDYADSGIRVVRLENIAPLRFIEEKRTYIAPEKYQSLTRHTLLAGDILFSSFVDEEVRVCLLPEQLNGKAINKADCFCIRANSLLCRPEFLTLRLACKSTFEALDEAVHGATRPRINLGQLKEIAFDLPSLSEQDEIVRRTAALLDLADDLERRLEAARNLIEHTTPSCLAKAFRGELVHQDPNDEPASELLTRVQSQRAVAAVEPQRERPKGARKRSTMSKADKDAIKAAILKLKADRFSFDEVRAQVTEDYESVKDAIFELLQESNPVVRQVFDKKTKTIRLVRVRP
jgi:type I restriction enzyme S subunit